MTIFEANISYKVSDFLIDFLKKNLSYEDANKEICEGFGIKQFFENNEELQNLKEIICHSKSLAAESDRAEYGDFQTNFELANKATQHLVLKNISPEIIIEPTCGKGNFIIAVLQNFENIECILGIEIYKPYVWETKFNIINFFLEHPQAHKPQISIVHCSVFDFNFKQIANEHLGKEILIIGNPPWVTNAQLGSLNSSNLPKKSNFKNHSGLDAMTGKGNFDIAEFITITMIKTFQKMKGHILFLVKNSVIKNIVFEQNTSKYAIKSVERHGIDSKKEFNVSVEASLFFCELNSLSEYFCTEFNFYKNEKSNQSFGWLDDKFVSNIENYFHTKIIDGECPFVWRQGLKHDCSSIMELDKVNGHYTNGLGEDIQLEEDLVYGFLKSSDLKNTVINQTRKYTIVTQKKVGQDTKYIKTGYPKTFQYLSSHQNSFDERKSSIYINKPQFSIFGIGDYSFKQFKVAISGLYKTFHFTLILPQNNKPVMLDDTCYLLGFERIEYAVYTLILLNSDKTKEFLKSITFADAKRTFTKDVLMRIDILQLAKSINKSELKLELNKLNEIYAFNLNLDSWDNYLNEMLPVNNGQTVMF